MSGLGHRELSFRHPSVDQAAHRVNGSGLGLRRWRAALARRRFHDVADAVERASALRGRPKVQAALTVRDRIVAEQDGLVDRAATRLADAATALLVYGPFTGELVGVELAELRRLSRQSGTARAAAPGSPHDARTRQPVRAEAPR